MRGRSRPYADILRQKAQIKERTECYEPPHRLFRVFGVFVKLLRAEVSGNRLERRKVAMGVDFWQAFVGVCIAGLQEVGDPDGVVRVFFGFYEDEVARSTTPARFAPPVVGYP